MNARETCFYCRKPIVEVEWDHAPIPKRHGGTHTFPACIPCHDLKDRFSLTSREWSIDLMVQALEECGPLGRIYLAKAFGIALDESERRAS